MIRLGTLLVLGSALGFTPADAQRQSSWPQTVSLDLTRTAPVATTVRPASGTSAMIADSIGLPSFSWAPVPASAAAQHKSPFLAWFLSWLVPGGGQGYNGQWGKAAGFFVAGAAGFALVVANDGFDCSSDCGPRDLGLGILAAASIGSQIEAPIAASAINRKARMGASAGSGATVTLATLHF
jgi:hypothetical protein